jgi:hypothetical protein
MKSLIIEAHKNNKEIGLITKSGNFYRGHIQDIKDDYFIMTSEQIGRNNRIINISFDAIESIEM